MNSFEDSHSFIVRIWREPRATADAKADCRGFVEQVATQEYRYFRTLDELTAFIALHLTCPEMLGSPQPTRHEGWWSTLFRRLWQRWQSR